MSTNNQNFIIGLVSAIALVAGLIYTFISIHKANLEIRKLNLEHQKQKNASKSKSTSRSKNDVPKFPISIDFIIDTFFFLLFLVGSINAIVEYLANEVPKFALVVALIFVLIYSYILLVSKPKHTPINEQRYFKVAGYVGLFISLALILLLGIQRLSLLFLSPSPYDTLILKIFSLVVNLASVPLLLFSLVSLHRIIRYISNVVIDPKRA
ncbi:MAG: hypothetical protein Q7U68_06500 [Candidatus Roizmanbacteria bacterium]|nr:hypothetical protein [Candidatus Roizmanbacteria bacterium]